MMFLIILVFQMSDFRYKIKTELKLRYLLSDLKHLT
jgi:hypothetical protein